MNFLISLIIIVLLCFNLTQSSSKTCTENWECGNDPYTICQSKYKIFPGIGVDPVEGKVFVIGKYYSKGSLVGNVTVASVPINGEGTLTSEFTIKSDVKTGSAFRNTNKLSKYLPKSKTFLIQANQRINHGIVVGIYNDSETATFKPLWVIPYKNQSGYDTLGLHFDEINKLTYTCEYDVKVLQKVVRSQDEIYGSASLGGGVVLNSQTQCFGISNALKGINIFNNTVIYAKLDQETDTQYKNTTFYIGAADCVNCKRPFYHLYTYYREFITGFHVYNSFLYFSSKQGIFQLNVPGADKILVISNDPVDSFEFVDSENTIYYITDGKIKKLNVATLQSKVLYDSTNMNIGKCSCAYGFTGEKCNKCIDGIESWLNGNPTCVKLNYKGKSESCQAEWECGKDPYFLCKNSECLCRNEFFGNNCDQCKGALTWNGTIPICTPTYPF